MVLVFCLVSFLGSGMSLSLTYGSDRPLGSMGIRFLPSPTDRKKQKNREKLSNMSTETEMSSELFVKLVFKYVNDFVKATF